MITNALRDNDDTMQEPMTPKRKYKRDEYFFVFQTESEIDKIECQDALTELQGELEYELSNLLDIKDDLTTKIAKYQKFLDMCQKMSPTKVFK